MKYCLLLLCPIIAWANWAPEWDNLTGYDRSKRYLVTADVQQITRVMSWTNPITTSSETRVQTYIAVARPDASSNLLATWNWVTNKTETHYIVRSNQVFYYSVNIQIVSTALPNQQIYVSVADRLLLDLYAALYERALAINHPLLTAAGDYSSKRDQFPDRLKPSLFGSASLRRLSPTGPEYEWPGNYLHAVKDFTKWMVSYFVNTGRWPSAYSTIPIGSNRFWSAGDLLSSVGAPTNYFEFTPLRDWEGRWTTYGSVVTGAWVMEQPLVYDWFTGIVAPATTNEVFTNTVVDTCGNTYEIVGTNGQVVTYVCTNDPTAPGFTHADYGLKYIRPIIKKLHLTEHPVFYFAPIRTIEEGYYGDSITLQEGDRTPLQLFANSLWTNRHYATSIWRDQEEDKISSAPSINAFYSIWLGQIWFNPTNYLMKWTGVLHTATYDAPQGLHEGTVFRTELDAMPRVWLVTLQTHEIPREEPLPATQFCPDYVAYEFGDGTRIDEVSVMSTTGTWYWLTDDQRPVDIAMRFIGNGSVVPFSSLCDAPEEPPPWLSVDGVSAYGYYSDGPGFPAKILIMDWNTSAGFRYR